MESSFRMRKSPKLSTNQLRENSENIKVDRNSDPDLLELEFQTKNHHDTIWTPIIAGIKRVVSSGDLKYDLEDDVYILLPFYLEKGNVVKMKIVKGKIKNLEYKIVSEKDDVPRETNLKSFKIGNNTEYVKSWAKTLVVEDWKDDSTNICQTMITSYEIELASEFRLTPEQISLLSKIAKSQGCLPYEYDLFCNQNRIRIPYRYILGTIYDCHKLYSGMCRKDSLDITIKDIEDHLKNLILSTGTFIRYVDDHTRRNSGIIHFMVIDHICTTPVDVKFVIKCDREPNRILAISKIYPFDVRLAYNISRYHCFHPLERYEYEILQTKKTNINDVESIRSILRDIFSKMQIYTVKKSLCRDTDIESFIYANKEGDYQIVSKYSDPFDKDNEPRKGFKYTGIDLAGYVKGLAYPEGEIPTEHDSYIFFHSKDYYELILDPRSNEFLEFIKTDETHKTFRNPNPKDTILAVPFVCDRDQFKGKINLRWFYPDDIFRLLHLYIVSNGENPFFKTIKPLQRKGNHRNQFVKNKLYLAIFDLYCYGVSEENPSLESEFTQAFIKKFFWWDQ